MVNPHYASVSLGSQVLADKVVNRILGRDPLLEGTGDLEAIAIGGWLAGVRGERSVPAVKRDELRDVLGEVHRLIIVGSVMAAIPPRDGCKARPKRKRTPTT